MGVQQSSASSGRITLAQVCLAWPCSRHSFPDISRDYSHSDSYADELAWRLRYA